MRDPFPDGLFLHLRSPEPKPVTAPTSPPMAEHRVDPGSDHHTRDASIDAVIACLRRISLAEKQLAETIDGM